MTTTQTATDERAGLPSASNVARYDACPGSFLAERHAPKADDSSPDAESGSRIHAVLAAEAPRSTLTADELETHDACERLENELAAATYGALDNADEIHLEQRFWLTSPTGERLISGKPDLVGIFGKRALVIDYKTGRNTVEHAVGNLQLRTLVAILDQNFALSEITVAIVQPWAPADLRTTKAVYGLREIMLAKEELLTILEPLNSPNAARISGSHCTYCKAKAVCPEAREMAVALPLRNTPELITPDSLAAVLTNETLGKFLERAAVAVKIIDACKDEAKRRIEQNDAAGLGWTLKPGAERETITDAQTVFDRFCDAGGTPDGFMAAVTVAKGKLKDAVKAATSTKGKALDAQMEAILAGCTETKTTAPSLTRTNE